MVCVPKQLKSIWSWFVEGAAADVRSAIIGGIAGSLFGYLSAAFFQPALLNFYAFTNSQGYAQPLGLLNSAVQKKAANSKFEFSPTTLEQTFVCEFAHIQGPDEGSLMLNYLNRYPSCFSVSQSAENTYRVFANEVSGDMKTKEGQFFCKCGQQ